jgi:hypothetical protein
VVIVLFLLILFSIGTIGCSAPVRDLEADIPTPLDTKQSTPQEAIESYLAWLTYAFRNMDSEVATPTMTPDLAQRTAYYITMNAADEKALNQRLDSLTFVQVEVQDTVATVKTNETWTFNYLSLRTGNFDEPQVVRYEATYTVLMIDGIWRVQSVDVKSLDDSVLR